MPRISSTTLNTYLDNATISTENGSFVYAHLVKFERPREINIAPNATIKYDTSAKRYAYLTDAAFNISYNDGSTDLDGNSNGTQVYVANKLTSVGAIQDTSELKIASMNIKLDATLADASLTGSFSFHASDNELTAPSSLFDAGFREDDIILIPNPSNVATSELRILKFSEANKKVTFSVIGGGTLNRTTRSLTATLGSEEVIALLRGTQATSFVNRKVTVYKVFYYPEDSSTQIGDALVLFDGIISTADYNETPTKAEMQWGLKSNWGDFQQVRGRVTSDDFHRALNENGQADLEAAIRPEYANDLGFVHADKTIDLVGKYKVQVEKTGIKKKGLFKLKVKQYTYFVTEGRETDLKFNLESKYLPVIYGVRRIDGNPIFADTDSTTSSQVFTAEAICEGPIHGFLNISADDNSYICLDPVDAGVRSSNSDGVDVVCSGRADRGDTWKNLTQQGASFITWLKDSLAGKYGWINVSVASGIINANGTWDLVGEAVAQGQTADEVRNSVSTDANLSSYSNDLVSGALISGATASGILHEGVFLPPHNKPMEFLSEFHTGTTDQKASSLLTTQAVSTNGFKLQKSFYGAAKGGDYWGPAHRLLDTAYVASKFTLSADDTSTVPLDYTIKGMLIECRNYDGSYRHAAGYSSENAGNFYLAETVTLKTTAGNSTIASGLTITDQFFFIDSEGERQWRFRWNLTAAQSIVVKGVKEFYMEDSSGNEWHMETYDATDEGTIAEAAEWTIGSTSTDTSTDPDTTNWTISGASSASTALLGTTNIHGTVRSVSTKRFASAVHKLTHSSSVVSFEGTNVAPTSITGNLSDYKVVATNKIIVTGAQFSSTSGDSKYVNKKVRITKQNSDGDRQIIERNVTSYAIVSGTKIITVDKDFEQHQIPQAARTENGVSIAADKVEIFTSADLRATSNPAIQLLDYMTSKRYGGAIDEEILDIDSFLLAAQTCDTTSDITVRFSGTGATSGVSVGDIFKYSYSNGSVDVIRWQGTVKSIDTSEASKPRITFTSNIGKLTNKFNNYSYRTSGDLIWTDKDRDLAGYTEIRRVTSSGNTASNANFTTNSTSEGNFSLTKVSGGGSASSLTVLGTEGNPVSYALYDSDDVKYWKYLNWDSHDQRWVTRHQTNIIVDTSKPVFKNAQAIVEHFNGVLSYTNGKYVLSVKTERDTSIALGSGNYSSHSISEEDIIGKISIKDKGTQGTFNSLTANIQDPQSNFNQRNVNFFNSEYLKQDRGITRSTQFALDGITNYFNARMAVKQILDQSRFNRTIAFQMRPTGANIVPGEIIQISNDRFGWTNKYFRVETVSLNANCLVNITAEEHEDDTYVISAVGESAYKNNEQGARVTRIPGTPGTTTALDATDNEIGQVTLTWSSATGVAEDGAYEIWRKPSQGTSGQVITSVASKIGSIPQDQKNDSGLNFFVDNISSGSTVDFYYWVRAVNKMQMQTTSGIAKIKSYFGPFNAAVTAGVEGETIGPQDGNPGENGRVVELTTTKQVFDYSADANTKLGTHTATITATKRNTPTGVTNYFRWYKDGVEDVSERSSGASSTFAYTSSTFADMPDVIEVRVNETAADSNTILASDQMTLFGIREGSDAITIALSNEAHSAPGEFGTFPSNSQLAGSGTNIRVFNGTTALDYNASLSANNTFKVTAAASGISISGDGSSSTGTSTSADGKIRNFADHVSMSAENVVITFTIEVKKADGTTLSFIRQQTVTASVKGQPGTGAQVIHLDATDYSVVYDQSGANPSFTSPSGNANVVRLTATAQGYSSPEYRFTVDGSVGNYSGTATHDITYAGTSFSTSDAKDVVKVEVREGSSGNASAEDSVSIVKVRSGSNANTTHEVTVYQAQTSSQTYANRPADPTSAVYNFSTHTFTSGLGSWTQSFPQAAKNQMVWSISASPQTASEITSSTTDTLAASDWSNALLVDNPTDTNVCYKYHTSGTTAPSISAVTGVTSATATAIPSGWYDTAALALAARNSANQQTTHTFLWQSFGFVLAEFDDFSEGGYPWHSRARFNWNWHSVKRLDGTDAYTVILSNETHSFPSSSTGAVSSTAGSGTTIEVLRGGTTLTGILSGEPTADQFKVVATPTSGNETVHASSSRGASVSNGIITYADHTGGTIMSGTSVTSGNLDYEITISTGDTKQVVHKRQTFSKVSSAAALTATVQQNTPSANQTTITFSDGSPAVIVSDGDDGNTEGVKIFYADNASGGNQSTTQGSRTFVKYVEYTGTAPTSGGSSGFVKFIGTDGTPATDAGVKPIYATDASGTSASFTQGSRTFVNFYEWTGSAPSNIPSGLTYVKYIGDDGVTISSTQANTPSSGQTKINFSDGSSVIVNDGSPGNPSTTPGPPGGTGQGVKIFYADNASGSNESTTQGSRTFVKYVEYTGTAPTTGGSSGFVKFIGTDGTPATDAGVKPIYATDASGTSASFSRGTRTFVNFYEWTGSAPSTIPSGLTYVRYIGTDGNPSTTPGPTGPAAWSAVCDRTATFFGEVNNNVIPSGNVTVTFTFTNGTTVDTCVFNFSADGSDNSLDAVQVSKDSAISYVSGFGMTTGVTSGSLTVKVSHSTSSLTSQATATYQTIKGN